MQKRITVELQSADVFTTGDHHQGIFPRITACCGDGFIEGQQAPEHCLPVVGRRRSGNARVVDDQKVSFTVGLKGADGESDEIGKQGGPVLHCFVQGAGCKQCENGGLFPEGLVLKVLKVADGSDLGGKMEILVGILANNFERGGASPRNEVEGLMAAELGQEIMRVGGILGLRVEGCRRGAGDITCRDEPRGASAERGILQQGGEFFTVWCDAKDTTVDPLPGGDLSGCRGAFRNREVAGRIAAESGVRKLLDL